jgi:hypothetical protein
MAIPNDIRRCPADPDSPAEQDRKSQGTVLGVLVDEHPIRMTLDELILVMHADPETDDPGVATKDAIRELVSAGLVNREGRHLSPTRAALYFHAVDLDR